MEKLGQLRRADEWDLIVVDTPPSRSALDFLDAPQRLGRFLDGKLLRLLTAPAKVGGRADLRVLNAGFGMVTGVLTKILGRQVLRDVQTFVSAMDTMFGGFRERAEYTYRLLRAPGTAFLVIAAPEPDALREASYFVERLDARGDAAGRADAEPGARARPRPGCPPRAAWPPRRPCRPPTTGRGRRGRQRWPWPRCGCTPSGCSWPPRSGGWPSTSPRPIRTSRSRRSRRSRTTCTTWTGSRRSARVSCGPDRPRPAVAQRGAAAQPRRAAAQRRSVSWRPVRRRCARTCHGRSRAARARRQRRAAPEQRTALPLGHPAPHAELDPVVQRVREALGADGAAAADQLGPVLRRALDEKLVRVRSLARGAGGPVRDPHVAQLLLIVTPAWGRHAGWRSLAVESGLGGAPGSAVMVAKE